MYAPQDCEAAEAYPDKSRHEEQHTEADDAKIARDSTLCHTANPAAETPAHRQNGSSS